MKQNLTKIFLNFCCLFLCLIINSAIFAQDEATNLVLNNPLNSEIKDGKKKDFTVLLSAGQTAVVEVKQTGVDAAIAAVNPAGEIFLETESPGGVFGSEFLYLTATQPGKYTVEVHATNPRANSGAFAIELKEIRASIPEDHQINEAAGKITKLAYQADRAKASGTVAGRREALAKWREIHALSKIKKDRIWESLSFIAGGLIYETLGEMQNAIDFYTQSLEIYRAIENRQYEGIAINNLGTISMETGDYEHAVSYYFQALGIHRETENQKSEAVTLNNLGHAYLLLENYAKAKEFLQPALKLRIELEDKRGEANTMTNLGRTYLEIGDVQKGIEFLQKALEIRRTIKDRAGEANSLLNLGKAFWDSGEKPKAFENFTKANLITLELGDRSEAANTFYWLAILEQDKGNVPKAIEHIEKGLELVEKIRSELSSSDLRVVYFAKVQDFYELYTDLIVERGEKTKNDNDFKLALEMSEKARARGLRELLQEARVDIKQGIDPHLLEQETDVRNALDAKYGQRERLLRGQPKAGQLEKNAAEINELLINLNKLNAEIRRTNKRYADLTQGASLAVNEIQQLLDDETILLEYKLGKKRSFLWLATKDSVKFFLLPSRSEIERKAKSFYDLIIADKKADEAKTLGLSKELGEMLLAPIVSDIKNKRIAVVADGVLQYIPFSALISPKSKVQSPKSAVGNYLIETNEIINLPSASVLAELRSDTNKNKSFNKTISIFADAVYDKSDSRITAESEDKTTINNSQLQKVFRDFGFGEKLPRLLASRQEAKSISQILPENQVNLNTDFEANLENLENADLKNVRILHFATHGLLNTKRPELSGLVLSIYDEKGKQQDGFLSLNDIYNLDLAGDLVVLSACQTALGKNVRGEGLIGLSRGFLYAGSKRIVASLWKVDDSATAEFMSRFYKNHLQNKMSASSALRQAKLEMMRIPRYKSPFYWSAFTLLGEWKNN